METIEYTLQSKPDEKVRVPAAYAEWADTLIKSAMSSVSPSDLDKLIQEDRYLQNTEFVNAVLGISKIKPETPESLKLQDIVYLSVCRAYCFDRVGERDGREGIDLGLYLTKIIEGL
jgi:hypothetical protein